jgi:hypothetical protein
MKANRESSNEREEVSRIFSVLQRNLDKPSGHTLGINSHDEDPKRDRVRNLLHKHLKMKNIELRNKKSTEKLIDFNTEEALGMYLFS